MWDVAIFKKNSTHFDLLSPLLKSPYDCLQYTIDSSNPDAKKGSDEPATTLVMSPSDSEITAKWRFSLQCQHQEMSFKRIVQRTWLSTVTKRAWVMCTWQHATTNIILRSSMPCPVSNQMSLDCPGNLFTCLGSQNFAETYSNCSANLSGCVIIVMYLYLKISNACSFQMN